MEFKIGELFCGPGGLSLGAVKANRICNDNGEFFINHGWATDFDLDSCNTYLNNIDGATKSSVIQNDVKDLDIDSLGEINCFAYGFPCNDFSLVGEQKGFRGKFGPLYS